MPSLALALGLPFLQPSSGDSTPGGVLNTYTQPAPNSAFTYRAPGGTDLYLQP